jgi:glycyl-tRNA synthetase
VSVAEAAAHLSKADLATSTVMEMTALAGTMGRHYAYKQVGALPATLEACCQPCLLLDRKQTCASLPCTALLAAGP